MAQMASRASVEFYVGLALKARVEKAVSLGASKVTEEAFVIRTFRNGLNVFVSKLVPLFMSQAGTNIKYNPILQAWHRRPGHIQARDEV